MSALEPAVAHDFFGVDRSEELGVEWYRYSVVGVDPITTRRDHGYTTVPEPDTSAIIIASLPGFFGGLIIPTAWIGILGIVPILIGVSRLFKKDDLEIQTVSGEINSSISILSSILSPQTYQVTAVTFANGGDNIGIYIPLFASSNLVSLGIILSVFFVLVGVWCYVADHLTRYPVVSKILTRYGHAIIPFVLIGLGIFLLIENGTYRLLPQFN